MNGLNKYNFIEFVISSILAIVSFIFSVIIADNTIVVIITATITIVSLQNATNVLRDNNNNSIIKKSIINIQEKTKFIDEYIYVDELEKIEREFCSNDYNDATIFIISNNLTNDKTQFLDEIIQNISKGVKYVYIVNNEYRNATLEIKNIISNEINSHFSKIDINEYFRIFIDNKIFEFCPQKYTIVIYDKGLADIYSDNLRGFCCAQDKTETGIYYFEMSHKNTKEMKSNILEFIETITPIS